MREDRQSLPVRRRFFFECYNCKNISSDALVLLFEKIVERSGMKLILPYQKAEVEDGVSIQGIWEASTLSIHEWHEPRFVTVDIYSCKEISPFFAVELIIDILEPEKITFGYIFPEEMVVIFWRE